MVTGLMSISGAFSCEKSRQFQTQQSPKNALRKFQQMIVTTAFLAILSLSFSHSFSKPLIKRDRNEPCAAMKNNTIVDVFFDGNKDDAMNSFRKAFENLDVDGDGNVTRTEFKKFLTVVQSKNNTSKLKLGRINWLADLNGMRSFNL